ncbi:MAG: PEP-CTERM sorting domain-containing protein [Bryobacterales bacterium]|nr:PEP-CTERM sorting domain-containing protein [Bryobacterales bacterium]
MVNFNRPGYATFPSASSPDISLGGYGDFTLTNSSSLTINEASIEANETQARSFSVTLSLQYRYSNSDPWITLTSKAITISSPSGTGGQIPMVLGPLNDQWANENDAWDVRFLFDGVYAEWMTPDGNFIRAQVFGSAGWTGASINPVEWNYNGDVEALYLRVTYDTPEPAPFVLLGSALLGLGLLRRRRRA